jgi:hypothetical protein
MVSPLKLASIRGRFLDYREFIKKCKIAEIFEKMVRELTYEWLVDALAGGSVLTAIKNTNKN